MISSIKKEPRRVCLDIVEDLWDERFSFFLVFRVLHTMEEFADDAVNGKLASEKIVLILFRNGVNEI